MEKITKEQYEQAKSVVKGYERQLKAELEEKTKLIKIELEEYFSKNEVSGCKIEIFKLSVRDWFGEKRYDALDIIPIKPYFDEDYWDKNADADIKAIGLKYGIRLGWVIDVYPK